MCLKDKSSILIFISRSSFTFIVSGFDGNRQRDTLWDLVFQCDKVIWFMFWQMGWSLWGWIQRLQRICPFIQFCVFLLFYNEETRSNNRSQWNTSFITFSVRVTFGLILFCFVYFTAYQSQLFKAGKILLLVIFYFFTKKCVAGNIFAPKCMVDNNVLLVIIMFSSKIYYW